MPIPTARTPDRAWAYPEATPIVAPNAPQEPAINADPALQVIEPTEAEVQAHEQQAYQLLKFTEAARTTVRNPDDLIDEVVAVARMSVLRGDNLKNIAAIYKVAAELVKRETSEQHLHLHGPNARLDALPDAELYARLAAPSAPATPTAGAPAPAGAPSASAAPPPRFDGSPPEPQVPAALAVRAFPLPAHAQF